jgi:hypothetical protein
MKKNLWMAMGALLASVALFGGTITVTQPAGGSVTMGSSCPIAWTSPGVTGNFKIQLIKSGGAVVGPLMSNVASSPQYWTVAAPAEVGQQYKIRVHAMDGSADGESALFTVIQGEAPPLPGSITNVQLGGSSPYCLGTSYTVSWTVTGVTQHLKLELIKGGAVNAVIAPDMAPGTSSKSWTAAGAVASDYKVRVSALDNSLTAESAAFELKTCGSGGTGLHAGSLGKLPLKKTNGTQIMAEKIKGMQLLQPTATLPGVYQNWPGTDTFPSNVTGIPHSVYDGVWNQITPAICYAGGSNHTALAGIYWFPYGNVQVAVVYRSRIIFYLSEHVQPGATLESAKLKMKRLHSIHEDANSGCGCEENLWVLKAPWTSYDIPAIGPRVDIDMGAAEFTKDVTQIVKNWLDGTVVNNGLLLLAGELPCSGGRKCFSCYEASLLLYMK